jgi:hypothetical protein
MTKNEILQTVIKDLLIQRGDLVDELRQINYNELSWSDRKFTLENSISIIDMNLNTRIVELEK